MRMIPEACRLIVHAEKAGEKSNGGAIVSESFERDQEGYD